MRMCEQGLLLTQASIYFRNQAFFDVTQPEVAKALVSRITDNFQLLKPASSS